MNFDPKRDLEISRIIKAPRASVWEAWTTPAQFEKWWIPAPTLCRVVSMDLRPGGALTTEMSEDGSVFTPHLAACYLDLEPGRRLVFSTAMVEGWRPADAPFISMTAVVTLDDDPQGTAYRAVVKHQSDTARDQHEALGFHDGWGTVAAQLAALVER
ncbi:SRPBCC family protein [Devosia sp. A449]